MKSPILHASLFAFLIISPFFSELRAQSFQKQTPPDSNGISEQYYKTDPLLYENEQDQRDSLEKARAAANKAEGDHQEAAEHTEYEEESPEALKLTPKQLSKLVYSAVKEGLADEYGIATGELRLHSDAAYLFTYSPPKPDPTFWKKVNIDDKDKLYKSIEKVKIEKLEGVIRDGYFMDITLTTADPLHKVFFHKLPIGIKMYHEEHSKRTMYQRFPFEDSQKPITIINVNDILSYESYSGNNYHPSDVAVKLTPENPSIILKKKSALNDLFNVSLFTDLLGDADVTPNGLVQTEITFKERLNATNARNSPSFAFHFIQQKFILRKFDNKYKYTSVGDTVADGSGNIDRLKLIQSSFFEGDLTLNLLHAFLGPSSYHSVDWNIGADLAMNKIRPKDTTRLGIVLLPSIYSEFNMNFRFSDNFGMSINNKVSAQFLAGENIKFITNREVQVVFNHNLLFYYAPGSKLNSNIFVRLGVTYMPLPVLGAQSHMYPTAQIGYQIKFSDFINMKKQ